MQPAAQQEDVLPVERPSGITRDETPTLLFDEGIDDTEIGLTRKSGLNLRRLRDWAALALREDGKVMRFRALRAHLNRERHLITGLATLAMQPTFQQKHVLPIERQSSIAGDETPALIVAERFNDSEVGMARMCSLRLRHLRDCLSNDDGTLCSTACSIRIRRLYDLNNAFLNHFIDHALTDVVLCEPHKQWNARHARPLKRNIACGRKARCLPREARVRLDAIGQGLEALVRDVAIAEVQLKRSRFRGHLPEPICHDSTPLVTQHR